VPMLEYSYCRASLDSIGVYRLRITDYGLQIPGSSEVLGSSRKSYSLYIEGQEPI
jgi:hypothetical protein